MAKAKAPTRDGPADLAKRLTAALEDEAKQAELGRVAARLTFYLGPEAPHALARLVAAEGEVSAWLLSRGRSVDAELGPEDLAPIVRETWRGPRSFRFARMFHQVREIVAQAGGVRVNPRGTVEVPAGIEVPNIPEPLRMRRVPDEVALYRTALTETLEALGDTGPSIGPEDLLRAVARREEREGSALYSGPGERAARRVKAKAWDSLKARGIIAISGIPPRRKAGRPKKSGQRPPR